MKEKLLQEILNNDDDSHKNLQNLVYLNAVIKETLRFYGPVNAIIYRTALKDHYLDDIFIPKGTLVNTNNFGIHRNSKYYENPHCFNP